MRKEYYFFLVLIMSAAIITGSTLSLKNNFNHIFINSPNIQTNHQTPDNSMHNETVQLNSFDNKTSRANFNKNTLETLNNDDQIVLEEFIQGFFKTNNIDSKSKLAAFQKQHNLNPTGDLTEQTIAIILNEAKTQRARLLVQ